MARNKSAAAKATSKKSNRKPRRKAESIVKAGTRAPATESVRPSGSSSDAHKRGVDQHAGNNSFPVVGIGASAGGLEAFRQLLEHLPVDTGMAFVLVQHLDPTHDSILTELLSRSTRMPVSEVQDRIAVAPDHVYVIPRNTNMAIAEGVLRLLPREEARGQHRPIDYFLRTLAEDQSHRAIGVILSGTASDGTLGLEAIKAEGGVTFAEDPKSAKYDSMPRSAIAAGHVDFILTPEGIAHELAQISRHPHVSPPAATATPLEETAGRNGFRKVLVLLRRASGVDFTDYKASTLHRRISRRMVLNRLESMEDYARLLRENAAESEALYQDILINVTRFFRNPEAFVVLKERIFPKIVEQRTPKEPIRIWTLGCSTGEEAYSVAMSFVEFAGDRAEHIPIQIFATDLSDRGIEKARAGLYSKDITEDVSPERLRHFFTEADGGYRVTKPIRDMVVFARQNVIADPPFSRLDLISCRNLLIYLEPVLQRQVLPTLHYALKPAGILWLGSSETIGAASELFTPEDKKHRFYSKKQISSRLHFQSTRREASDRDDSGQQRNHVSEQLRSEHDAHKEADRILLARYSPASVLINTELEILQFRGSTGAYLEAPPGKATLNLLKMAREGLMLPLRAAIQKAKKDDATTRKQGVRVQYDGAFRQVNLEVVPINGFAGNERSFLVLFEPASEDSGQQAVGSRQHGSGATVTKGLSKQEAANRQVARLREELADTREYMQSLIEQREAANEELQSSSEEVQSSNEELQSLNEELETAKEELESSNEELTTLNDELQTRNLELTVLNDDQSNLFDSVSIPIVMLGRDLRIRRFTPQAEKVLNLISTDVGRRLNDIKLKINVPDLESLLAEVIDAVSVKEREVQDSRGHWYAMRVRPYTTLDNKIDGAVIVLADIDALKRSEAAISQARDYAEAVIRTARDPLLILNADLRIHTANHGFYNLFKVEPAEAEGRLIYELGNRQWDIPKLRELLEDILPRNSFFNDFEVTHDFEAIGRRAMLLNARTLDDTDGQPTRILLGIQDVTGLLQFQAAMRRSEIRYRRLFEAAQDGVLIVDPQTRKILDANPFMTELLGYRHEELLGKELFEIGLLKDEEASRAAFRVLQEKEFIRYEDLPLETKTGERREVEMVSNLYIEDGEKIIQCNIRDVTERKRADEALLQSEERYRTLFDLGPVAVYSCDTSGVIRDFNRHAAELWGREPAVGDTDQRFCGSFKMFRPDGSFMPHEQCPMAEVLSGKISEARDAEVLIERPDGSRITVIVNIRPLKNKGGEVAGAINCFYDITERKQAEEARARLAAIVECSDDAIVSKDLNGVITSWNAGAERLFGYTAPEIVGQSVTVLIPPERFDEETTILEHIHRAEPVKHYETVRRRKDGTLLDVSLTVSPILDSQGHIVGASKIARDITEQKRAEEALRESETRFRELADAMPQIVWAARPDGYIDYYNQRWYEYTGYDEAYGQESWEPILHPDDVARCVDTYYGCVREGTPYQIEYRFKDRFRGGYRWFMGRALPIKNEQGEIVRWFGSCTDIDEVKRAEEEREKLLASERAALALAETANRVKDEFLATVSHELRTPLNAMMGWADILLRGKVDETTVVHAAETIARNAKLQNQLIADLLDVSRIISGKLRLEMGAVELAQVIEAAIDTVRPAADARRMDVRLLPGDAVGLVSGDAGRLQQIVWNLLSNAIKYSAPGGRVLVRLEREGTNVAIIVRDTGEGIRPEVLPYIFDRFRQADSATTRLHGGLGLGLAIVHHLVEAHGGTVHADSAGPGEGATFTVTLPLIAVRRNESDAVDADETEQRRPSIRQSLNEVRVFVVDDDRDNRELLSLSLSRAGAEVRAGASVREALAMLDQWMPDVLVSDIGMPEEDGYTLIKELRSRNAEEGGLIPALALTGYAREADATRAREAGFQMHLSKPVETATLIAAVTSLAGLKRSRPQTPEQSAGRD